MSEQLFIKIKENSEIWASFQDCLVNNEIPAKTVLLNEGEISEQMYFINSGCLRLWFNKDGKDITFQFFFENQSVASIDSFINSEPSIFTIESLESTRISSISKKDFNRILEQYPSFKDVLYEMIIKRFSNYSSLFLSRIKDSPQERYKDLLENNPEIIQRIPQHYIASYLGITPISLSRIRNRK